MERARTIEYGLVLLLGGQSILAHYANAYDVGRYVVTVVLLIILALHVWRAILAPGYVLAVLNTVLMFGSYSVSHIAVAQAILWALLSLGVYLFPLPRFPALAPAYPVVGCATERLEDLDCRIFYPAQSTKKQTRQPYLHHGPHLAKGLSIFAKIPAFVFSNFKSAWLHANKDAPLLAPPDSNKGWPVVVFSHGLGGTLEMYALYFTPSIGFVVFALNHNDGSASVNRLVDSAKNVKYDYYHPLPPGATQDWDNIEYKIRNGQLHERVDNVEAILNSIESLQNDPSSAFYNKLDLDAIGLVGHSFGGATVFSTAKVDRRVKAVVALDIWMAPLDKEDAVHGPSQPVCHLISQQWVDWVSHMKTLEANVAAAPHPDAQLYAIKHSRHNNFSDLGLFSPKISQLARAAGSIDTTYVLEIIADVTGAYLKHHLAGTNAPSLSSLEAKYPELCNLLKRDTASGYETFASSKPARTL
ncbi:hypothetical protein ACHHYP_01527 [Achlya hypogyna]|uniref:1-alkyl-2-acetylglycerophosphocholine esterase n=1 Tax=Achlya hypogyna TaxID=1202772 RepID=A0A1V9Z8D3_ACHHY|nr:hypothetical protein ACHHYP_01527 [Achlya hypogyna]